MFEEASISFDGALTIFHRRAKLRRESEDNRRVTRTRTMITKMRESVRNSAEALDDR
jgi:hypothetical protein